MIYAIKNKLRHLQNLVLKGLFLIHFFGITILSGITCFLLVLVIQASVLIGGIYGIAKLVGLC